MSDSLLNFPDILRLEGVMAKGFGVICKYPMQDTDLDISAKAVYALLCALAGNDHCVFPSRDKIMDWLGMGRGRYTSGMKQLKEQGYIIVEQVKGNASRFAHNSYTIVSNPKKFVEQQYDSDGGELTFAFSGLKSAGYGMLPRMVMFDQRLSCTAKVIYAYLASYSGAGKVAFPKSEITCWHLGLNKDTFFKHLKQLVETNYITREKRRNSHGQMCATSYHLNDCPDLNAVAQGRSEGKQVPYPKNRATEPSPKKRATEKPATVEPAAVKPTTVQPTTVQPPTVDPTPENPPITINSSSINSSTKNNFSKINPSMTNAPHWTDGMSLTEIKDEIIASLDLELYTPNVRSSYKITMTDAAIGQFIDIIAEFIYSRQASILVRGTQYTREEAISRLLGLSLNEYQVVFDRISQVSNPIKNRRKYILASLVTALEDIELQTEMEVQRDFG